jgi:hypothetical protein
MTNKTLGYAFEMNIDILSIHPPGTSHFCWHTNAIGFFGVFLFHNHQTDSRYSQREHNYLIGTIEDKFACIRYTLEDSKKTPVNQPK